MLIIVVTVLLCLVAFTWIRSNSKKPPGPWGLPILGYLPWIDPKQPYATFTDLAKKYGPIYGLDLGNIYTVVLTDPKTIRKVFANDVTTGRAPLYVTHGIMKGYGLICSEGDLWKDQRKFVHGCLRLFGGSKIGSQREKMQNLILSYAKECVKYIAEEGKDDAIDPLDILRHCMGSAINMFVFGRSWSRDDETWKWLQHLQEEGTKHIGVAGPLNFLPFLRFVPKFNNTMKFLIEGKVKTHELYKKLIEEEKINVEKRFSDSNSSQSEIGNLIQAFLIERRKREGSSDVENYYNDEQFYHLLADVFGAGLDTTLTTLRWYLLFMAVHEDIQKEVYEEISSVLENREPSLTDFESLPLFEASICETQRIRSVVPTGIPHGSLDSCNISGYHVPKGTMIVPLQWAIHMDEAYWKDPHCFNPRRFLSQEEVLLKPEAFLPFQAGKRMCVGDELARMLLFLFGASILQRFQLSVIEEIDLVGDCGITLTPKPHRIKFDTR